MTRWLIGLSSGTSWDGVEAALVEVDGIGLEMRLRLMHFLHQDYPRDLQDLILRVSSPAGHSARHASLLHRLLGETFAQAVQQVADQARFNLKKVQCIGFAGQTFGHETDGRFPSTLGLGMPAVVAERTGLNVVSDFRTRDVVVGGQGFPLTPVIDYLLFRHAGEHRILLHLGGLASLVSLPAGGQLRNVVGFQAAPCNILLDNLMRRLTGGQQPFDAGGKHAVQGRCLEPLVERWLAHPALQRRPPRCLPPQTFGEEFVDQMMEQAKLSNTSLHDLLCTATHFVARGITSGLRRFLPPNPQRVLLSGGGVKNGFLWHLLQQQLPNIPVEKIDQHGYPAPTRKAISAAGLAALTVDCVPANLPAVTGAAGTRLLGSITPGSSANWARCLTWMASQAAPLALSAA
jgi:anhydro-N-acetylmuramic acid kinase